MAGRVAVSEGSSSQLPFCSGHNTDWNVIKWARFAQGASLTGSSAVIIPLAFSVCFLTERRNLELQD